MASPPALSTLSLSDKAAATPTNGATPKLVERLGRDTQKDIGATMIIDDGSVEPRFVPIDSHFSPETFAPLLKKLVVNPAGFSLDDVRAAFYHLAAPAGAHPSQMGAFLAALHLTGKDAEPSVVAACADVMQRHALSVDVGDFGVGPVCDIVGTGGDGHNTFNVSTTAGIVAAGAGARVYKHGNRAATSSSGSADILMSLGCPVMSLPPSAIPAVAEASPFLFLFAPNYHPAMVRVAPVRKAIAFPSVFNALGPLINPARPSAMIVGVHSKHLGPIFVEALRITGVKRAWVVCGAEGLDEISPAGPTHVWDLLDGVITEKEVSPATFGLSPNSIDRVRGGTPEENAALLLSLLAGELPLDHPVENFVAANCGALLFLSGLATDPIDGVRLARESIKSGKALEVLELFRKASQAEAVEIAK